METIIKNYKEKFGYSPSIFELHNLYTQGSLLLSDNEENILIKEFNKKNELWNTKLKENQ
tara:strand:- start:22949 stop:23128 length:180 start_codon:yes stop_codon:yes gene_type:complete